MQANKVMGAPAWKRDVGDTLKACLRLGWDVTREAGASVLTYELYPLGLAGQSVPVLPVLWKKPEEDRPPILFIHGVLHNSSAFAWLKQRLALHGWRHFREINLATTWHSIPTMAAQTKAYIEKMLEKYQVPQVDIVAHSMGGIIARYMVQVLEGEGMVRNLITLGTPHQGTKISKFSLLPQIRELSPGSQTIQLLNSKGAPRLTQAVAVSGGLDLFMVPKDCVWWAGVRNIHLQGVGHAGLLFSRRVLEILVAHLNRPQKNGARKSQILSGAQLA